CAAFSALIWKLMLGLLLYASPCACGGSSTVIVVSPCHLYHSDVFIVDDVSDEVSIPIRGDGSVVVDDGCDVLPFGRVAVGGGLVVASGELYGVDAFDDDVGFFRLREPFD